MRKPTAVFIAVTAWGYPWADTARMQATESRRDTVDLLRRDPKYDTWEKCKKRGIRIRKFWLVPAEPKGDVK